jgi:hypothetical protein
MAAEVTDDHALPWTKMVHLRLPVVVGAGNTMDEDERRVASPLLFIEESCSRQCEVGHRYSSARLAGCPTQDPADRRARRA